ncbi:MAG: hypothetical protein QXY74_07245 [Candidatus Bathyarchaeia archaeon]
MKIIKVHEIEQYKAVEKIQNIIWGPESGFRVLLPLMLEINRRGGLVEAVIEEGEVVGYSIAFVGKEGEKRYLYS